MLLAWAWQSLLVQCLVCHLTAPLVVLRTPVNCPSLTLASYPTAPWTHPACWHELQSHSELLGRGSAKGGILRLPSGFLSPASPSCLLTGELCVVLLPQPIGLCRLQLPSGLPVQQFILVAWQGAPPGKYLQQPQCPHCWPLPAPGALL